jgi:hypothetical protein
MARHKITATSDIFFHQKIMNKYSKTKKNYFKFPMMIFLKNIGYFLTKKLNLDFLFRLGFHSRSLFALMGSEINVIRNFRDAYKNISMQYKTSLPDIADKIEVNSFMKSANFKLDKVALAFDNIIQILLSFNYVKVNNQFQNYFNKFQTIGILAKGLINDTERKSGINAYPGKENRISSHLSFKQGSPAFHSYNYLMLMPQQFSQIISIQIKKITGGKIFNDSFLKTNPILLHSTFYQPDKYCLQRLNYTYVLQSIKPWVQKNVLNESHSSFETKSREINSKFNLFQINNSFRNDFSSPKIFRYSIIGGSQKQDFSYPSNISQFITTQTQKISPNMKYANVPTLSSYQTIFVSPQMFELKSPVISLKNNSFLNNRTLLYKGENSFNEMIRNSSVYGRSFKPDFRNGPDAVRSKEIKQNNIFKDHDNFFFKNNQKIEQKIEQVKKIAEEVKNTVTQKSISVQSSENVVDRQIDIKRISDQVYQMIDHRIKIEKERRGYL